MRGNPPLGLNISNVSMTVNDLTKILFPIRLPYVAPANGFNENVLLAPPLPTGTYVPTFYACTIQY